MAGAKHTSLPWTTDGTLIWKDQEVVAHVNFDGAAGCDELVQGANAAFIVRACNNHQRLIDALWDIAVATPDFTDDIASFHDVNPASAESWKRLAQQLRQRALKALFAAESGQEGK